MEVSSHSTELYRVKNLGFKAGIFTNLTEDHLIFHETMENYYQAKKKFFYQCDYCIINIDDDYGKRMYNELKAEGFNLISYSSEADSDFFINDIVIDKRGSRFSLNSAGKAYEIEIKTPGKFNVYNYVGAMIAANLQGIDLKTCIDALESIRGVEGRFEFLETRLDCTIILDFAHTPDGLEKVMETINQFAKGRKIVLFGAGGERDKARRSLMGEVAGRYCDFVMLTSDNPINEDPKEICREIAKGVEKYHNRHMTIIDREEAVRYLIKNYEPDDTILLAGKSTEPYQMVGNKKIPYFEKTIALKAIKEMEDRL
jgi:UDP-N-acetylmuramoyl-L-alanyl-D-glutamate--2,6-diaminopimelate ligase